MATIRKSLLARLETLRNDFLQRFGETEENERFIEELRELADSVKGGEEKEIRATKFSGLLETMKRNFRGNKFILEFEFSSVEIQIMTLERILAAQFRKRLSDKKEDDIYGGESILDTKICERVESAVAYMRTLGAIGIDEVDRNSLGWGAGIASQGSFTKGTFEFVERYTKLIEKNERLKYLAEKIGRHSAKGMQTRMKADGTKPAISYDGIYNSDNLKTILPTELALYTDKRTRTEFLRRLSDRQVLCYKPAPDKSAADGNNKDKGPVIICLDTSGSMHGIPEAISKATALSVIKNAAKEKRETLIISFSVTFEVLRIKRAETAEELHKIVEFLASSFHGGTDIGSALAFAISATGDKVLRNADVLTISDFVSSDLSAQTIQKIRDAKKSGTRFYAMSIGDRGRTSILTKMDETIILSKEMVK